MTGSTSSHGINADRNLSKAQKGLWLMMNGLNNLFPLRNVDPDLELVRFRVDGEYLGRDKWDSRPTFSPSRTLSDIFWRSIPWNKLSESVGGRVRALEVGCGSGKYGVLLQECLGDGLAGYTGIDVNAHRGWEGNGKNPKFTFEVGDSSRLSGRLSDFNLIVTQSALEHFDEDLGFFRQVAEHAAKTDQPMIQIHLMPSAGCISTFPWHGVRQYTPRTLSKATRLFGSATRKVLYSLGSTACNRVHRRYITYPWILGRGDLREQRADSYRKDLREAIARDQDASGKTDACFYALVLESRLPGKSPFGGKAAA
jgi:SAM-dependent methyltransferase